MCLCEWEKKIGSLKKKNFKIILLFSVEKNNNILKNDFNFWNIFFDFFIFGILTCEKNKKNTKQLHTHTYHTTTTTIINFN